MSVARQMHDRCMTDATDHYRSISPLSYSISPALLLHLASLLLHLSPLLLHLSSLLPNLSIPPTLSPLLHLSYCISPITRTALPPAHDSAHSPSQPTCTMHYHSVMLCVLTHCTLTLIHDPSKAATVFAAAATAPVFAAAAAAAATTAAAAPTQSMRAQCSGTEHFSHADHSHCSHHRSFALLASQVIRTARIADHSYELLLGQHQIQRQLQQQSYRSNERSQQLQSQQRSGSGATAGSGDRLAPESHPGARQQSAQPPTRCSAKPGQQAQGQRGLLQKRRTMRTCGSKRRRTSDGTQGGSAPASLRAGRAAIDPSPHTISTLTPPFSCVMPFSRLLLDQPLMPFRRPVPFLPGVPSGRRRLSCRPGLSRGRRLPCRRCLPRAFCRSYYNCRFCRPPY